jgi:aldose 1-epimerase
MGICIKTFIKQGRKIQAYTLTNELLSVTVLDYGAIISHLFVNNGSHQTDVVLGYDDPFDYIESTKNPYFGAIIGRSCNRIENGTFTLNETRYQLPINNGINSLHGGEKGFDKKSWKAVIVDSMPSVQFELLSPDLDQGYPGSVKVLVTYTLEGPQLIIETRAELIDDVVESTMVNMTSHPYFNLSGCVDKTVRNHIISMPGVYGSLEMNDHQIPTGGLLGPISNPELFFTEPDVLESKLLLVQKFKGFDHFYLINNDEQCVTISSPTSKITLSVSSDCSGFQFYTGNWIEKQPSKSRHPCKEYEPYSGFCIEPSQPPNAINLSEYRDSVIVTSTNPWNHKIVYKFTISG